MRPAKDLRRTGIVAMLPRMFLWQNILGLQRETKRGSRAPPPATSIITRRRKDRHSGAAGDAGRRIATRRCRSSALGCEGVTLYKFPRVASSVPTSAQPMTTLPLRNRPSSARELVARAPRLIARRMVYGPAGRRGIGSGRTNWKASAARSVMPIAGANGQNTVRSLFRGTEFE